MSVFDGLSSIYDMGMLPLEWLMLRKLRRQTFPLLGGNVLEIGIGTGVNLPLYGPEARVTGCDASGEMLTWAARRFRNGAALAQTDVQRLPFPDGSFDVVAASFLFCSVTDPAQGLAEAHRVLRPGGKLVLLEHTRGNSGLGAWLTDTLHPAWKAWSKECHLNRETAQTVAQVGFQVRRVEQHALGIVQMIEATVRP
ncbi:MAG: methyltransferase domain-containing protein [Chloroflexota bacterium]|nr:methyltransferase domain-containing protein [Chloroflexota bacterium]